MKSKKKVLILAISIFILALGTVLLTAFLNNVFNETVASGIVAGMKKEVERSFVVENSLYILTGNRDSYHGDKKLFKVNLETQTKEDITVPEGIRPIDFVFDEEHRWFLLLGRDKKKDPQEEKAFLFSSGIEKIQWSEEMTVRDYKDWEPQTESSYMALKERKFALFWKILGQEEYGDLYYKSVNHGYYREMILLHQDIILVAGEDIFVLVSLPNNEKKEYINYDFFDSPAEFHPTFGMGEGYLYFADSANGEWSGEGYRIPIEDSVILDRENKLENPWWGVGKVSDIGFSEGWLFCFYGSYGFYPNWCVNYLRYYAFDLSEEPESEYERECVPMESEENRATGAVISDKGIPYMIFKEKDLYRVKGSLKEFLFENEYLSINPTTITETEEYIIMGTEEKGVLVFDVGTGEFITQLTF